MRKHPNRPHGIYAAPHGARAAAWHSKKNMIRTPTPPLFARSVTPSVSRRPASLSPASRDRYASISSSAVQPLTTSAYVASKTPVYQRSATSRDEPANESNFANLTPPSARHAALDENILERPRMFSLSIPTM